MLWIITAAALAAGLVLPLRWGVFGYAAAAAMLFAGLMGINTASGFSGSSLEESLLLFNGSWTSYLGFNAQVTYRAFALPLLALSLPFVFRLARSLRRD